MESFFMKMFIVFILITHTLTANCQTYYPFTTQFNRYKHDKALKDSTIHLSLQQPLSITTEGEWQKAFWAMELLLYKTRYTKYKLKQAWRAAAGLTESFQKALLEVSYTLYPGCFSKDVKDLLRSTISPALFIRCAEYLLLSKQASSVEIENILERKFVHSDFPGFTILKQRLKKNQVLHTPPLKDIFSKNFLPGQTLIYSLQRRNREYAGLALIRKPDGSFVKARGGSFFHTTQLARAITNYPFYITNGNTPQGVFRWTGFDTSSISYIGPTPNLQMVMPYEASPAVFFDDRDDSTSRWSLERYSTLLPPSWRDYNGIYESFFAGAMGRSEVIMHGTTINPDYYKGQSYFPQTPSLGCLCSYEEWSTKGQLVFSNQQMIVDALKGIGSISGYVVVIDIDNKKTPVRFKEIAALIP